MILVLKELWRGSIRGTSVRHVQIEAAHCTLSPWILISSSTMAD